MTRLALIAALASGCALAGCGDDGPTSPDNRLLPLGVYHVELDHNSGELTITDVTPEDVTAEWTAGDFEPEVGSIGWNVDAYVLIANRREFGGQYFIRAWRDGSGIACTARFVEPDGSGGIISTPASCSMD